MKSTRNPAPDGSGGKSPVSGEPDKPHPAEARAALMQASRRCPFGPAFFMTQLRGFAKEKCPDPATGLPVVELHLADGAVLDLCHIIGMAPTWVALAVHDTDHGGPGPHMRSEFVPFEIIMRVTLRSSRPHSPHLGFEHTKVPQVLEAAGLPELTPEAAIEVAATGRTDR